MGMRFGHAEFANELEEAGFSLVGIARAAHGTLRARVRRGRGPVRTIVHSVPRAARPHRDVVADFGSLATPRAAT